MKRRNRTPYLMLIPGVILMSTLVFYPILRTFVYSLQRLKLTEPDNIKFIGFENYRLVFQSESFWISLQNSLVVLIIVVVIATIVGLLVALLLNVNTKIKGILTAIAIIPWALPPVVNGVMWRWIFHPSYGLLNRILLNLNVIDTPIQWLSERWSIIFIVSLVVAWRNIPFCAIVILSALQAIPTQIYESALIDGSKTCQTFKSITLPLIMPSLGIVLTSTSINAINVFDEIVSLSGYSDISKTLMIDAYLRTFSFLDYGMGSALTYIIMLLAGILGLIYIKNLHRKVEYM